MLFNSLAYLVFLPIVFTVYWLMKADLRWVLILIASYFFYMCSGPMYGLLILFVTATSYLFAILIEKTEDEKVRKPVLLLSVITCMGVLFVYKYFDFFGNTLSYWVKNFGGEMDFVTLNLVLPVGISFYTFQSMSYVIDVYRGDTKAEHHFGKYAAFVSFFPQLVAGPIERSSNLLPQIKVPRTFDYEQAMRGVKQMLIGYYKKLVIADILSEYVELVYQHMYYFKGFSIILATLFFTLQIYCDFSGYSDIAIGTAKLFGIDLMTNFKSPYFSKSIKEFWSRWHISLSTWFKDYVYIPLGGNRVGAVRHSFNLLVTFLVSGLWHGADWTFVIWGGVHGIAQVLENTIFKPIVRSKNKVLGVVRNAVVFIFCAFAWIFFVSSDWDTAVYMIQNLFVRDSSIADFFFEGGKTIGLTLFKSIMIGVTVAILAFYDYMAYKHDDDFIGWISGKKKIWQWLFYCLIALFIVFVSKKGVAAEFIYFQF